MGTFQENVSAIARTQWRYGDGDVDAFRTIIADKERVRLLPGGPRRVDRIG